MSDANTEIVLGCAVVDEGHCSICNPTPDTPIDVVCRKCLTATTDYAAIETRVVAALSGTGVPLVRKGDYSGRVGWKHEIGIRRFRNK
jgi:hypothetical protein